MDRARIRYSGPSIDLSVLTPEYIATTFHRIGETGIPNLSEYVESVRAYQRSFNPIYARFEGYSYLPIQAFKRTAVTSFPSEEAEHVFISSGTGDTGQKSHHYIKDLDLYRRSVVSHFQRVFGGHRRVILAHLPSYVENKGASSLVMMVQILMESFGLPGSQFFLADLPEKAVYSNGPVLLIGAAFGLIDLAEKKRLVLPDTAMVVETGGMKTHRREVERDDLHSTLAVGFGVERAQITSEYGMCELLSQFYMRDDGFFYPPPWVSFDVIDMTDLSTPLPDGIPGALAVFDVANLYSVSGILTQDRAIRRGTGFELLGRLSGAELRGCNFLVEERVGTSSD